MDEEIKNKADAMSEAEQSAMLFKMVRLIGSILEGDERGNATLH